MLTAKFKKSENIEQPVIVSQVRAFSIRSDDFVKAKTIGHSVEA